jgi:hypothetical protein
MRLLSPQAYKDLSVVMKNQESLTGIVHPLLPLINVKVFVSKGPKKDISDSERESSRIAKNVAPKQKFLKKRSKVLQKIHHLSNVLESETFLEKAPEAVANLLEKGPIE